MEQTIATLAKEAREHFSQKARYTTEETRDNPSMFWTHDCDDKGKDAWIYEMTRKAHDGMLPDDYKYAFIVDALDLILDNEPSDENEAREIEIEPDTYTSDLLKWLSSSNERLGYCDDYVLEYGAEESNTEARISGGQRMERQEVFNHVLAALAEELSLREMEEV